MTPENLTEVQLRARHGRRADGFRSLWLLSPPASNARTHRPTRHPPSEFLDNRTHGCLTPVPAQATSPRSRRGITIVREGSAGLPNRSVTRAFWQCGRDGRKRVIVCRDTSLSARSTHLNECHEAAAAGRDSCRASLCGHETRAFCNVARNAGKLSPIPRDLTASARASDRFNISLCSARPTATSARQTVSRVLTGCARSRRDLCAGRRTSMRNRPG